MRMREGLSLTGMNQQQCLIAIEREGVDRIGEGDNA